MLGIAVTTLPRLASAREYDLGRIQSGAICTPNSAAVAKFGSSIYLLREGIKEKEFFANGQIEVTVDSCDEKKIYFAARDARTRMLSHFKLDVFTKNISRIAAGPTQVVTGGKRPMAFDIWHKYQDEDAESEPIDKDMIYVHNYPYVVWGVWNESSGSYIFEYFDSSDSSAFYLGEYRNGEVHALGYADALLKTGYRLYCADDGGIYLIRGDAMFAVCNKRGCREKNIGEGKVYLEGQFGDRLAVIHRGEEQCVILTRDSSLYCLSAGQEVRAFSPVKNLLLAYSSKQKTLLLVKPLERR